MGDRKELCSSKIVCKECGCGNVQTVMWVDANTNRAVDHYAGDWAELECNWCEGCDDHVELVHLTKEQAHLMRCIREQGVGTKGALESVLGMHNNIL